MLFITLNLLISNQLCMLIIPLILQSALHSISLHFVWHPVSATYQGRGLTSLHVWLMVWTVMIDSNGSVVPTSSTSCECTSVDQTTPPTACTLRPRRRPRPSLDGAAAARWCRETNHSTFLRYSDSLTSYSIMSTDVSPSHLTLSQLTSFHLSSMNSSSNDYLSCKPVDWVSLTFY